MVSQQVKPVAVRQGASKQYFETAECGELYVAAVLDEIHGVVLSALNRELACDAGVRSWWISGQAAGFQRALLEEMPITDNVH